MSNGIPKRADVYWFFHVNVTDEPYTVNYNIETFIKNDIYYVELNLGFRINPRVDFYFRQIIKFFQKFIALSYDKKLSITTNLKSPILLF